jgi:hypothetical protein
MASIFSRKIRHRANRADGLERALSERALHQLELAPWPRPAKSDETESLARVLAASLGLLVFLTGGAVILAALT